MTPVDVVLIGRNEGARLVAALRSVQGQARTVVYVDSGSTDDSRAEAERAGARVIELDLSTPFTAARARNAGFDALEDPQYVQFIDGDCALVPGHLEAARDFLDANPDVGMVTGWRSEIHRDATVYNQLCDFEWRRPAGDILACGGDMMVRAELWRELGGMNPIVIASEDEEICCRLRKAGWRLHRIPREMTRHDVAMTRFGQWWSRAVRTGHGFAQVGLLHPEHFSRERQRAWIYGFALPLVFVGDLLLQSWLALVVLALYALNYLRTAHGLSRDGLPPREALHHSVFLTLSKFPNLIGMMRYYLRRLRGADMRIIEYK